MENHGKINPRFILDDAEQEKAYELLSKLGRNKTLFITALICEYLEKNDLNPYAYEDADLKDIVTAYIKLRRKGSIPRVVSTQKSGTDVTSKKQKPKPAKPTKNVGSINSKISETDIDEWNDKKNEELLEDDFDDIPDSTDAVTVDLDVDDDEAISEKDMKMAMQSLSQFMGM